MRLGPRAFRALLAAVVLAFIAGGGVAIRLGEPALGAVFIAAGLAALVWVGRAPRPPAPAGPFPEAWRRVLEESVAYYRRLGPGRRADFERNVAAFIAENRFTGVKVEVDDELKVLAAASATMLLFGRPGDRLPRIAELIYYPGDFDEDFRTRRHGNTFSGMHAEYGAVLFSAPELRADFDERRDTGRHLGLHEFAHVLDSSREEHDGVPAGMDEETERELARIRPEEMRIAGLGASVLDPYAATNAAEFWAVATETYFTRPRALRERRPELHAVLFRYYGPLPAGPDPDPPARRRPEGPAGWRRVPRD